MLNKSLQEGDCAQQAESIWELAQWRSRTLQAQNTGGSDVKQGCNENDKDV